MARIRSIPSVVRPRSSPRQTSWFEFVPAIATLTASGGTIFFSLNAAALALRPFTVVRTRFLSYIFSDQVAADETQLGAVGVAVVSDQASAIGVTAVPTPITDMGSDLWFVHQVVMSAGTASSSGGNRGLGYPIDSKAMRKVDIGQDIVVVAELSASGSGFNLMVGGRMLVKIN